MNTAINLGTRRLHKLLLVAFVFLTFVQVVFLQHRATYLDSWNKWLIIAGFIFSLPRAFPVLVESPFYGLLSFLLRVRSWIPVVLCMLLVASFGLDLFLPNSQSISSTGHLPTASAGQPVPGSTPSTSVSSTGGQPSSSSGAASQTPVPTLSASGTQVLNDPMASPVSTDPWNVVNQPNVECGFVNGAYDIKVIPQQVDVCETEGINANLSSFIYEITMTIVQGDGYAGIVFRDESTSSTITDLSQQLPPTDMLLFDQRGNYNFDVIGPNGKLATTKTGLCSSFHQGLNLPNQIDAQVTGQRIDIFVNGVYLISAKDDQLDNGHMGVILMADDTTISEATYSNLGIWKLG